MRSFSRPARTDTVECLIPRLSPGGVNAHSRHRALSFYHRAPRWPGFCASAKGIACRPTSTRRRHRLAYTPRPVPLLVGIPNLLRPVDRVKVTSWHRGAVAEPLPPHGWGMGYFPSPQVLTAQNMRSRSGARSADQPAGRVRASAPGRTPPRNRQPTPTSRGSCARYGVQHRTKHPMREKKYLAARVGNAPTGRRGVSQAGWAAQSTCRVTGLPEPRRCGRPQDASLVERGRARRSRRASLSLPADPRRCSSRTR